MRSHLLIKANYVADDYIAVNSLLDIDLAPQKWDLWKTIIQLIMKGIIILQPGIAVTVLLDRFHHSAIVDINEVKLQLLIRQVAGNVSLTTYDILVITVITVQSNYNDIWISLSGIRLI